MRDGRLSRLESRGHAVRRGAAESAPCAAVSAVVRGLGLALVAGPLTVDGDVSEPGHARFDVVECTDDQWMAGLSDGTLRTLEAIAHAWPNDVELERIEE